jgi:hypothetical protein
MNPRLRKLALFVVLALYLTALGGQTVSAGIPIRCGSACITGRSAVPPPFNP